MATDLVGRTDSGTLTTIARTRFVDTLTKARRALRPVHRTTSGHFHLPNAAFARPW